MKGAACRMKGADCSSRIKGAGWMHLMQDAECRLHPLLKKFSFRDSLPFGISNPLLWGGGV